MADRDAVYRDLLDACEELVATVDRHVLAGSFMPASWVRMRASLGRARSAVLRAKRDSSPPRDDPREPSNSDDSGRHIAGGES